jgi:hypothetical protein
MHRVPAAIALLSIAGAAWWILNTERADTSSARSNLEVVEFSRTKESDAQTVESGDVEYLPSDSVRAQQHHADWVRSITAWLIERGDAESLTTAALLMQANMTAFTDSSEKRTAYRTRLLTLFDRAATQAPTNAVIQMLAFSFCSDLMSQGAGCDPSKYDTALRLADPNNSLSWLGALAKATEQGDHSSQANVIATMVGTQRFDDYRHEREAMLSAALNRAAVAPPKSQTADSQLTDELITGAMRASPFINLTPLFETCAPQASNAIAVQCLKIARMIHDNDNWFYKDTASELLARVGIRNSADAQQLHDAQRRQAWQRQASLGLRQTPEQIRRLRLGDGRVFADLLLENGIPLDPSAEWTPADTKR